MNEEKLTTNPVDAPAKKAYSKPTVSKVRLVAEEAVLGLCKRSGLTICRPALFICNFTPSS